MESSNTMSRAAKPYDDGRKKKSTDPVGGDKACCTGCNIF